MDFCVFLCIREVIFFFFFFSSRRRHTRLQGDWSSDVCSSDLDGRRGRGIGFAKYKNLAAYVAVVADVEVDRATGAITVPRAFAVADAGLVINPDGLINQIEGGVIQSTSWTLREAISYDSTRVLTRS